MDEALGLDLDFTDVIVKVAHEHSRADRLPATQPREPRATPPRRAHATPSSRTIRRGHFDAIVKVALGTCAWIDGEYIASTRVAGMLNVPGPFSRIV